MKFRKRLGDFWLNFLTLLIWCAPIIGLAISLLIVYLIATSELPDWVKFWLLK